MASLSIKLVKPLQVRRALFLVENSLDIFPENTFKVMYKCDDAEDDDYIEADFEDFLEAKSLPEYMLGRTDFELWVWDGRD